MKGSSAGFYWALIIGAWFTLSQGLLQAQPVNDLFANRIVVLGSNTVVAGNNIGATSEVGEPQHAENIGGSSVWWTWTAPFSGRATISTAGSDFDTVLGVYTGTSVTGLAEEASNDDNQGFTSRVDFFVSGGQTYQIAVDGYGGDFGAIQLTIHLVQAQQATNDLFANRIVVSGTNAVVTGNNTGSTFEAGEPDHAGVSSGLSIWWSWTAPFSGVTTITTAGSDFDTVLGVYAGPAVSSLAEIASNDDAPGSIDHTSKVTVFVTAGQVYQIAVDGYSGTSGNIQLNIQLGSAPQAPAWVLPDPYGQPIASTNFTGRVILFNFWASWCGPCKVEMPDIVALQDKYRADGLVVVGATISDVLQDTLTFLATNIPQLNYQIILADPIRSAFGGIDSIPTTFIINRQNQIVGSYVGSQSGSTFERQIIPLLYDNMRLTAEKSGNQLLLHWPTNAVAFKLDSTAAAQIPVWSEWPTLPTVVNGSNTVSIPLGNTNLFFRLRLPY